MMSDLYRLVYYSRNCIKGTPDQVAAGVDAILHSAWRNNASLGVTGALIFNAGIFAQVLEGCRQDVKATFERIQDDPRHSDVRVLAFEQAPHRGFPAWSMAFVGSSREGEDLFGHIGDATDFRAERMQGERVFEILHRIAIEEETHAT